MSKNPNYDNRGGHESGHGRVRSIYRGGRVKLYNNGIVSNYHYIVKKFTSVKYKLESFEGNTYELKG